MSASLVIKYSPLNSSPPFEKSTLIYLCLFLLAGLIVSQDYPNRERTGEHSRVKHMKEIRKTLEELKKMWQAWLGRGIFNTASSGRISVLIAKQHCVWWDGPTAFFIMLNYSECVFITSLVCTNITVSFDFELFIVTFLSTCHLTLTLFHFSCFCVNLNNVWKWFAEKVYWLHSVLKRRAERLGRVVSNQIFSFNVIVQQHL